LADQADRDRFASEWDRNFSVAAPAGVGKTTAIAERVAHMALAHNGKELLAQLAVLTYTRKAAGEIRRRVEARLHRLGASGETLSALGKAFFGTIDSFFSLLLRKFDHWEARIVEWDDPTETRLWEDFLEGPAAHWTAFLPQPHLDRLLQLCSWRTLAEMAHRADPPKGQCAPPEEFSEIFWDRLLPREGDDVAQIVREQSIILSSWRKRWKSGQFAPFPVRERWSRKPLRGTPFADLCEEYWQRPLARWVESAGGMLCGRMAEAYGKYRLERGFATYGDLRRRARELLADREILRRLRDRRYRIILDEAQDTDPEDLAFFLALVPQRMGGGPAAGHFSSVGDLQQCIYLQDSDKFEKFQKTLSKLETSNALEPLTFSVTMRCPRALVERVNCLFPSLLTGGRQAQFVPMAAHSGAAEGAVHRLILERPVGINLSLTVEMEALAAELEGLSPTHFGVKRWGQVAILGGIRKTHLATLQGILVERGIPAQLRLRGQNWGSRLLFRWICGIFRILSQPADAMEVVVVLREVFGVSDNAIARFLGNGRGQRILESLLGEFDGSPMSVDREPIGALLRSLGRLRRKVLNMGSAEAFSQVEAALELLVRANRCERAMEWENRKLLSAVQALAFQMEADGRTLYEFCDALQEKYFAPCGTETADPDRLQIDTIHGSKGLEWDVVLLAFCGRPIALGRESPPLYACRGGTPKLAMTAQSPAFEEHAPVAAADRFRVAQRLLYVAMTRARRTLILVRGGQAQKPSQFSPEALLGIDLASLSPWQRLEQTELPQSDKNHVDQMIARKPKCRPDSWIATPTKDCPVEQDGGGGRAYGIWWHRTMEYFPWKEPLTHSAYLERAAARSPDPSRATRELDLLLGSDWYKNLNSSELQFLAEWPFEEQLADRSRLARSVVDLILCNGKTLKIVDWKTEHLSPEEIPFALAAHGPQLDRYCAFFRRRGFDVSAGIYFSSWGQLVSLPSSFAKKPNSQ
jgi:ATP-dependent exoDNAse (exonuclease V) beta subunit